MAKTTQKQEITKPIDYSKPLENPKHERFCQEQRTRLNATESYKVAYPKSSGNTPRINGSKLLAHTNISGRISYLQNKLSEESDVTAQMLMDEWKKIGFANVNKIVGVGNSIKAISSLPDEVTAGISSVSTTKTGTKVTMHSKETALEHMGKLIGAYEKDNSQKKDNLADFLKAFKE